VRNKEQIRKFVWDAMEIAGLANGGTLYDKIPDFKRSYAAATNVINLDVWKEASVIKSNPDKAQRPLRKLALESGKTVYMAVPRLRQSKCFVEISSSLGAVRNLIYNGRCFEVWKVGLSERFRFDRSCYIRFSCSKSRRNEDW